MESHEVDMAFSGIAAVELLESDKSYDLIITDLKMQGVDGIQVLKRAKKLPSAPEVILITAFASQQTAVEAMRAGAFDYLIKPFEMEELSLRINRNRSRRVTTPIIVSASALNVEATRTASTLCA